MMEKEIKSIVEKLYMCYDMPVVDVSTTVNMIEITDTQPIKFLRLIEE